MAIPLGFKEWFLMYVDTYLYPQRNENSLKLKKEFITRLKNAFRSSASMTQEQRLRKYEQVKRSKAKSRARQQSLKEEANGKKHAEP